MDNKYFSKTRILDWWYGPRVTEKRIKTSRNSLVSLRLDR
jgi:hypothetical protein